MYIMNSYGFFEGKNGYHAFFWMGGETGGFS